MIKLQINISNEIDSNIIEFSPYFQNKDISHIRIDLTFTNDEKEYKRSEEIVSYINKNINEFKDIKPLLFILKRYFCNMNMNKSYTGGLSSFSLFLLILSYFKNKKNILLLANNPSSLGTDLYNILEKFSFFDYKNFGIDVEGKQIYYLLNNDLKDNQNNGLILNNYEKRNDEINILDPITKLNVSKSSFQVEEIKNTFNKALLFLKFESWKYDSKIYQEYNNKNLINNISIDGYKENDFNIIKKLFTNK